MATSCVDDIEPAKPQENPQEPILQTGNIKSTLSGTFASPQPALNLEDYRAENAMVEVLTLSEATDLPAGASVGYVMELSDTEDFARKSSLQTYPGDGASNTNIYYVFASEWNDAHLYLFGKSPKVKTAYYRIKCYVTVDESNFRFGGPDYYVAQGTLQETCMDSGFVIEDNYYLLGNATSWTLSEAGTLDAAKFTHNPDVSVYDDPVFTLNFEVTQAVLDANGGGCYWKIAPQSSIDNDSWDGVVGPQTDGDTSASGVLVSTDPQAGKIGEAGKYKMTINMEEMTYKIEKVLQPEYLYTPGDSNGWNQEASAWLQVFKGNKDGKDVEYYYGVSPLNGGFKICAAPKWDNATDYGAVNTDPADKGSLVLGQAGANITPPAEGVYWIRVNYETKGYQLTDYVLTPITRVGLIGSFEASGWNEDNDIEMATADGGKTYTADIIFKANDEFKVRFNNAWALNLGGEIKGLTFDGANIKVETAGTYTVTLKLLGGVPTITMTKK